jgi:predicted phosphodiesterase
VARSVPTLHALVAGALAFGCFPAGWRGAQPLFLEEDFPFEAGPYLILVKQGHVAVVVKHPLESPPVVEYWIDPRDTAGTSSTTAPGGPPGPMRRVVMEPIEGYWVAVLPDLPLDTSVYYRVLSSAGDTEPIRFLAGASRGRKMRFAAFGDTRTGHQVHRELVEAMAKENIEFVIHSGDLVEFGGVEEQWRMFLRVEAPLMSRVPMFAAIGNHDFAPRSHFDRVFMLPLFAGGNRYYHQDWGDVRVVIMDSEIEMRKGSDQYAFLESTLAEAAEKDLLVLMSLHYPPYSSGAHGSYLEIRDILGELGPRFGVEIILAGHDHNYERTKPIGGVTYIVAASGGANIRAVQPSDFSVIVRTEPHFVLFDLDRTNLIGRAINLRGDTFDTFVVPPNPPFVAPSKARATETTDDRIRAD